MASHHTKDKGDLGVAKAFSDLVAKGYTMLFPATEHAAFDLVAYRAGVFVRVQVKYRCARAGVIKLNMRSPWADRHGVHSVPIDKDAVDVICIYCPDTDECYHIRPSDHGVSVNLRIAAPRNGQQKRILVASAFRDLPEPPGGARVSA